MADYLLGVNAGVERIGSNVFDHVGPSVGMGLHELGWRVDEWFSNDIRSISTINFSLSDFTSEPEGMDVNARLGATRKIIGPLNILGRGRVDFVRDLGNGENYHGLLFGGEGGFALDFKYVDLNITGGIGIGFMDRDDNGRFDTHYTGSALLDVNFWPL